MANTGDSVCAILSADKNNVHLIGYGKYLGDEIPDRHEIGSLPKALHLASAKNPKLQMNDGSIVWGCECWWGDIDSANEFIGNRNIINVDMEKERSQQLANLTQHNENCEFKEQVR